MSNQNQKLYVTIMAGGLGSRMKSKLPKVIHKVQGVPMLVRVIRQAYQLSPEKIMVIVGKYKPVIDQTLREFLSIDVYSKVEFVIQEVAEGTGHAVQMTLPILSKLGEDDLKNAVNIILSGDVPLITSDTIGKLISSFREKNHNLLQITCSRFNNPHGFGRIVQGSDGKFQKIVEHKDCNQEELKINLCNSGIYVVNIGVLTKYLPLISNNNAQQEYYLTDLVEITLANEKFGEIDLYEIDESRQIELTGINTIQQLEELHRMLDDKN